VARNRCFLSWNLGGRLLAAYRYPRLLGRLGFLGFDADPVVDGAAQLLLAPQVTFGRLDGDVAEQKLDLIQFAAG